MDEGKEMIDKPGAEMDQRIDEQERIVGLAEDNYSNLFEKLEDEGQITPEVRELLKLAEKWSAAREGQHLIEACLESNMVVEKFNSLISNRDDIALQSRDAEVGSIR